MKTMTVAALAALSIASRVASADTTGSPAPVAVEAARAAVEARALVATMQQDARLAREALMTARRAGRRDEVRCADEALSRADVALRAARDEVSALPRPGATIDLAMVHHTLGEVRARATAAHAARVMAVTCTLPHAMTTMGDTIAVRVDPSVAPVRAETL